MAELYTSDRTSILPGENALAQIVKALGGHRSGSQWLVRCPAHEDHNPSLAIKMQNGKILVHCHAGCSQAEVIAALRHRGVWPKSTTAGPLPKIVATYIYTDEGGRPLYEICRLEPGPKGKSKTFKQRYRDPKTGEYIWRKHPRQVLYHLPEVLEAPIVFVAEGEKDVESLRDYGFVATTNAGGADAPWLPEFTAALAGREVILIPDNDRPGRARAARIARALLGRVTRLVILELEGVKDVTEWFQRGHGELELIEFVEKGQAATR